MPRANGRSIVGQQFPTLWQHCWMLHVVSVCTPRCMLLYVVAGFLELLSKVRYRSNVWLRANGRNNSQHCCAKNAACCCVRVAVVYKRMQELPPARYNMQQGVQTDGTCNIQQCWDLLANNVTLFARGFKMIKNYSQRKSVILDVVIFSNFVLWINSSSLFHILHKTWK